MLPEEGTKAARTYMTTLAFASRVYPRRAVGKSGHTQLEHCQTCRA